MAHDREEDTQKWRCTYPDGEEEGESERPKVGRGEEDPIGRGDVFQIYPSRQPPVSNDARQGSSRSGNSRFHGPWRIAKPSMNRRLPSVNARANLRGLMATGQGDQHPPLSDFGVHNVEGRGTR